MNVEDIASSLIRGDAPAVRRLTMEALEAGVAAEVVLSDGLIAGMNVIGTRFRNGEIYVPEVLVAARAMKAGMEYLEPVLIACGIQPLGRCLVGTVKGDIHDIGKNLVIMMLRGAGFEVADLGVDVPPEKFMEAIRTFKPHIVGMSALLTTMMVQMEHNIAAFRQAGLLENTRVMVGGAPVTESFAREIGADAYGEDAADAKEKALELLRALKDR
jgi:5-methyltetrahydrofolate--homocysteine methyltransferase